MRAQVEAAGGRADAGHRSLLVQVGLLQGAGRRALRARDRRSRLRRRRGPGAPRRDAGAAAVARAARARRSSSALPPLTLPPPHRRSCTTDGRELSTSSTSSKPGTRPSAPTLLLLHGTGGNEHDLLPLGDELLPGAALLSPRGKVLEHGMPRFFRRLAEGVFDLEDLQLRAGELADFVAAAAAHYGSIASRVIAVGFSNGANIASGLLLLRPGCSAARSCFARWCRSCRIRCRRSRASADLERPIDPIVLVGETERLAACSPRRRRRRGAWQPGGHQLTQGDVTVAQDGCYKL